jgi:hypothetical protein
MRKKIRFAQGRAKPDWLVAVCLMNGNSLLRRCRIRFVRPQNG